MRAANFTRAAHSPRVRLVALNPTREMEQTMSFANRHNRQSQFTGVPQYGEKPTFKSLKELFEADGQNTKYRFHGFYVNTKGKFGNSPAAYLDGCICNFPPHMLNDMVEFTDQDIQDINDNKVGFEIEPYEKDGRTCYGVRWVDM